MAPRKEFGPGGAIIGSHMDQGGVVRDADLPNDYFAPDALFTSQTHNSHD